MDKDTVNRIMNEDHKKISPIVLILSIAILGISLSTLAPIVNAEARAADTPRTLSTTNPAPGSTFDVMLNLTGFQIGGVVETIPDGFTFIRTTHLSNRTYMSGQKVVFVVINETSLKYNVRAPLEGSGTFSGTWYDALNGTTGDINGTDVSVRIAVTPTPSAMPSPSPTPTPSPSTPGFKVVFALMGLLVYPLLFLRRRRNNKGGSERGGE